MTEQQTTATDNALVEALEAWGPLIAGGYECPAAGQRVLEAAERIKSLKAEVAALEADRIDGLRATIRLQTQLANETLAARTKEATLVADRQRMREALEKHAYVLVEDANGIPTHYAIKAEHREAALNPASKEANDG